MAASKVSMKCPTLDFTRVFCLILAALTSISTYAQSSQETSVEVRIPSALMPANCNGQTVLAYELLVTNFLPREITLNRVEVYGGSGSVMPLFSYEGTPLSSSIVQPAASTNTDKRKIGAGMRAVVYMWLPFTSTVPGSLRHKLFFTFAGADGSIQDRTLQTSGLVVSQEPPVTVPPFKGGVSIAGNGPSASSVHRRAMLLVGGETHIAQRFAIDWIKLGEDNKLWHGDAKLNANWYGYGTEALAVSDGVVASIKDGVPENTPLASERAVPITIETIGGNYVLLSLGHGRFAYYAHLQPGSIRVKAGDRVRRGQVLGLLGNSGNSDAPHLHFQIANGDSPMGSEGLPYLFNSFVQLGVANLDKALAEGWTPSAVSNRRKHLHEIPVENAVVRFD
jgi:hypothetical protein